MVEERIVKRSTDQSNGSPIVRNDREEGESPWNEARSLRGAESLIIFLES